MTDESFNNNQNPLVGDGAPPQDTPKITDEIKSEGISEPKLIPDPEPSLQEAEPIQPAAPTYVYHWDASMPEPQKAPEEKRNGALTFAIIMSAAFLIAILALVGVLLFSPSASSPESAEALSYSELYNKCAPFTVSIETPSGSIGSGFFISEQGRIVTNYHVVSSNATVTVHTHDGKSYSAEVVGSNISADIAVLDVITNGEKVNFAAATLGDSATVKTGDPIIVIGSPETLKNGWTLTAGYVSFASRSLSTGNSSRSFIQFDAPANPGNSGGPLINAKGEVIGIVQSKGKKNEPVYDINGKAIGYVEKAFEGISFAIPSNDAKATVASILKSKDEPQPKLGILGFSVYAEKEYFLTESLSYAVYTNAQTGEKYIIKNGIKTPIDSLQNEGKLITAEANGIFVSSVSSELGAYGKLQEEDIVTKIAGVTLSLDLLYSYPSASSFFDIVKIILSDYKVGDTVTVEFLRNGAYEVEEILLSHE